jgi:hypothetical protein
MRLLNTALLNITLLNKLPLNKAALYVGVCALALGLPGNIRAQVAEQSGPHAVAATHEQAATSAASPSGEVASAELPDSPGAAWVKAQDASPQQNDPAQSATPSSTETGTSQVGTSQTTPTQSTATQDQKPQRPVGTAAAEAPKVSGVTAAQPAGVAIAPAKQRRVRTIVLKVGAIVGAGAALGTVIALREATPSKPPGAH